jgi:hypothetical protein
MATVYSEKICSICGERYEPKSATQKYCAVCRCDMSNVSRRRFRAKGIAERKKRVRKHQEEMAEIVRKCEAAGLSYGQAVAKGVI